MGSLATSWSALSDERVKGNWELFDNAAEKLQQLTKLGTFEWVSGPGHETPHTTRADAPRQVGLSAQEIQDILPEAVRVGEDGLLTAQYTDVFVLGLKAIQELSAQNVNLKARLATTEARVARIEAMISK